MKSCAPIRFDNFRQKYDTCITGLLLAETFQAFWLAKMMRIYLVNCAKIETLYNIILIIVFPFESPFMSIYKNIIRIKYEN